MFAEYSEQVQRQPLYKNQLNQSIKSLRILIIKKGKEELYMGRVNQIVDRLGIEDEGGLDEIKAELNFR